MHLKSVAVAAALLAGTTLCQAQEYMDSIARSACDCAGKIPDNTPAKDLKAQAGVCLIKSLPAYKDKLKADFGLDLDNLGKDGERVGQIVGSRMATQCPAVLVKLAKLSESEKAAVVETTVEGVVTRIEKDFFVTFSLKDNTGKTVKLYWMSQVSSNLDLVNGYDALLGKTLKVTYQPKDFFDPKVSDYRQFNLITKIW